MLRRPSWLIPPFEVGAIHECSDYCFGMLKAVFDDGLCTSTFRLAC
jgi:hypothetical protein